MFKLILQDSEGKELKQGDIVAISDSLGRLKFFSEVKWLEKEKAIAPFHTFSFHSFYKVDSVPEHAEKSTEERYNIWFTHTPDEINESRKEEARQYLISWRECEVNIKKGAYKIELI